MKASLPLGGEARKGSFMTSDFSRSTPRIPDDGVSKLRKSVVVEFMRFSDGTTSRASCLLKLGAEGPASTTYTAQHEVSALE